MSPLNIANYLPNKDIKFDLVIIDEASQMYPEDSIGSIIRAKQVMIVGDTKQLPPSNFFNKVTDEDDESDEDEHVISESILDMAKAKLKNSRLLKWHYRSRHQDLIAFCNKYVYDDKLVVFHSPITNGSNDNKEEMGVFYEKVDGLYSSGQNEKEADVMIEAIAKFMKNNINKSLGVVLINKKQAYLLDDKMYQIEKQEDHKYHNCVKEYIAHWDTERNGLEPFFIKNLENVQGDERDVIFIGTVYGPEKEASTSAVAQRFGPINGKYGKRRLNVLFSRAKEKIITFSSMTPEDIKVKTGDFDCGVGMLRKWLEYSKTKKIQHDVDTKKETDSEFEDYVIEQIEAMGFKAVPQVGVKGYYIDIGVKHESWPYGYIMGVECDGANYHSSRSARDRDRLRQEILEGYGWHLYRIWSIDWFNNKTSEVKKLKDVLETRLQDLLKG
jgi:very-short-patch-repair endonuclease